MYVFFCFIVPTYFLWNISFIIYRPQRTPQYVLWITAVRSAWIVPRSAVRRSLGGHVGFRSAPLLHSDRNDAIQGFDCHCPQEQHTWRKVPHTGSRQWQLRLSHRWVNNTVILSPIVNETEFINAKFVTESTLQQNPIDRISVEDILKSKWLSTVDIPSLSFIQDRFMVHPTIGHDLTPLNSLESRARRKLEALGITAKMLCDNAPISSKSAIIGIYRIVINRYQLEGIVDWDSKLEFLKERRSSKKEGKAVSKACCILWLYYKWNVANVTILMFILGKLWNDCDWLGTKII